MQRISLDYIVVGQGLAGSALAMHLFRRGKKFVVFDLPNKNNSSHVAAGLFNPITGRNWVKTWKADLLFPYMRAYFKEAESLLNRRFFYEQNIYRLFNTLYEQNVWMAQWTEPGYVSYIDSMYSDEKYSGLIKNPYGGLKLKYSGYLDIPAYLNAVKCFLEEQNSYHQTQFIPDKIERNNDGIVYRNYHAKKVVLCEGSVAQSQKLWEFLPFKRVKGEVLTISTGEEFDVIFSKGIFIIHTGNGICKAGSTYDNIIVDPGPTATGKKQILSKLANFFKPDFKVIGHTAGMRPATHDRRPFLGMHPNEKKIVIFNGLGAKGVTLAPFFANQLLDHLENDIKLDQEVDIKRYI